MVFVVCLYKIDYLNIFQVFTSRNYRVAGAREACRPLGVQNSLRLLAAVSEGAPQTEG